MQHMLLSTHIIDCSLLIAVLSYGQQEEPRKWKSIDKIFNNIILPLTIRDDHVYSLWTMIHMLYLDLKVIIISKQINIRYIQNLCCIIVKPKSVVSNNHISQLTFFALRYFILLTPLHFDCQNTRIAHFKNRLYCTFLSIDILRRVLPHLLPKQQSTTRLSWS